MTAGRIDYEDTGGEGPVLVPTLSGYYWMVGLGEVIDPRQATVDAQMLPSIVELARWSTTD